MHVYIPINVHLGQISIYSFELFSKNLTFETGIRKFHKYNTSLCFLFSKMRYFLLIFCSTFVCFTDIFHIIYPKNKLLGTGKGTVKESRQIVMNHLSLCLRTKFVWSRGLKRSFREDIISCVNYKSFVGRHVAGTTDSFRNLLFCVWWNICGWVHVRLGWKW